MTPEWRDFLVAVITIVFGGGAIGIYRGVKAERRDDRADDRAKDDWGVNSVLKLMAEMTEQQERTTKLFESNLTVKSEASEAKRAAQEARDMVALIVAHARPLVAWIDAGAPPPPPTVSAELRRLLDGPLT